MPTMVLSFWQSLTRAWPNTSCQLGGVPGLTGSVAPVATSYGPQAVELLRVLERGLVAFALLGEHMDDDGPVARLGKLQRADQQGKIMAVNRPQIPQAHLLENQAAAITATAIHLHPARAGLQAHVGQRALEPFLRLVREFQGQFALGQTPDEALEIPGQLVIRGIA